MTALTSASFPKGIPDIGSEAATPSRQFMVHQAVLNTLSVRYPYTIETRGVAAAAGMLITGCEDNRVARLVTRWVAREYNALVAQYPRAA